MRVFEITQVYSLLTGSKMNSLDSNEKYKVIKVAEDLKKVSEDYQSFIESAKEKAKDDAELNEIVSKEAMRDCQLDIEKIGDTFDKLMKENDWTIGQTLVLKELLK